MTDTPTIPITAFTISRKTWLRGEGTDDSYLLRKEDRKMCCLGFYATACGVKECDIMQTMGPASCLNQEPKSGDNRTIRKAFHWLVNLDGIHATPNATAGNLMWANDDRSTVEIDREAHLTKLFANHGITVTFAD